MHTDSSQQSEGYCIKTMCSKVANATKQILSQKSILNALFASTKY